MDERLLVLGASGLLGQALVAAGRAAGMDTVGVARRGHPAVDRQLDLMDDAALVQLVRAIRPTVLINAAALVDLAACEADPGKAYRINARLPALLAHLAAEQGHYLVQISTDHFFTGDGVARHDEQAPVHLLNEYARSKFAGEAFVLAARAGLVLRTNIVGFRGDAAQPTFVEWVLGQLSAGLPMTLFSDYFTSSIHVGAFAGLLLALLPLRPHGLYNLASSEVCSKQDFVLALAAAAGFSTDQCASGSVAVMRTPPRAESLGLDVGRAEALLGRRMPGLSDTIASLMIDYGKRM